MKDINELARAYVDSFRCSDKPIEENDLANLKEIEQLEMQAFAAGYVKAREDLLSQASEGFEEAWQACGYHESRVCDSHAVASFKEGFSASKLSSLKEIRETKEACSLIAAQKLKEIEKLRVEVARLKEQVDAMTRRKKFEHDMYVKERTNI